VLNDGAYTTQHINHSAQHPTQHGRHEHVYQRLLVLGPSKHASNTIIAVVESPTIMHYTSPARSWRAMCFVAGGRGCLRVQCADGDEGSRWA